MGAAIQRSVSHPYSVLIPLTLALLASTWIALLGAERAARIVREWGPVEDLTVAGYGAVLLGIIAVYRGRPNRFGCHALLIVVCLLARELDLHRAFTAESVLALRYYSSPAIAPLNKAMGMLLVLGLTWLFVSFLVSGARRLLPQLRAARGHAYSFALAVALVPISKTLDAAPRIVAKDFGMPMSSGLRSVVKVTEEVLELAIPVVLLWALCQLALSRRARV